MNNAEFQLRGVHDARLAVHATSASPAWLWTPDGARLLWANPVGVAMLGAADAETLAARTFSPADQQRRQVAQLAARLLPDMPPRLERLRGFGAPLGSLVTCICTRLPFADGENGILIVAAATMGRTMPLDERLRRIVETATAPMAAFMQDGRLAGASETARLLLGSHNLAGADLAQVRDAALNRGHAEASIDIGHITVNDFHPDQGDRVDLLSYRFEDEVGKSYAQQRLDHFWTFDQNWSTGTQVFDGVIRIGDFGTSAAPDGSLQLHPLDGVGDLTLKGVDHVALQDWLVA